MQNKTGWKIKIAKIKSDTAREMKQDYLSGFTLPELMQMYGVTKKTISIWMTATRDEMKEHLSQVMAQNKFGRPKIKGKKRLIKIKNVAETQY